MQCDWTTIRHTSSQRITVVSLPEIDWDYTEKPVVPVFGITEVKVNMEIFENKRDRTRLDVTRQDLTRQDKIFNLEDTMGLFTK